VQSPIQQTLRHTRRTNRRPGRGQSVHQSTPVQEALEGKGQATPTAVPSEKTTTSTHAHLSIVFTHSRVEWQKPRLETGEGSTSPRSIPGAEIAKQNTETEESSRLDRSVEPGQLVKGRNEQKDRLTLWTETWRTVCQRGKRTCHRGRTLPAIDYEAWPWMGT